MALQASFSSSFSSSSSSFSYRWPYDVFLSFRGFDTRHGFTGNLYKALCDKGIRTFIDDEELQRGKEITPALVKAIQESRIAIPVFSKNYASSSFCLDELVIIMEYIKGKGRLVLPVFYDVDPCDVRHQRGSYGQAMAKHEERFKDIKGKVQKWRKALYQAANLSGKDFKLGNEYEYIFIEKIVKEISNKISRGPLYVADYPVGLESQVLEVNSLLNDGPKGGVLMVGIYGIGGIGKTTLARAVYNFIADQFECLCFLENVRENSIKHGLVYLQEKLLYKILRGKDIKLESVSEGIPTIKHRLHRKKVLLVLDDVDKLEQLRKIVGGPNWFGFGSRVIITTRDKHLLASHGIERKYEVKGLSENEALMLLSWNAFKYENVDPSYKDILMRAVTYACRLPLALQVIGSNLFGKSIEEWSSALKQYKRIPNYEIQKILKISFDALEKLQQQIFLDIACCFKGYNWEEVKNILLARHDVCPKYSINVLVEKSLIKIDMNCVTLHDLIQDMAKEIVRQESPKNLGKRSRLWLPEDTIQVLEDNIGTSEIEVIILDAPKKVEVEWDGDAFKKMRNLEILIIRNAHFSQGANHLPNSLRVLEWWKYPSNSLPSDFHPKKLGVFNLSSSSLMSLEILEKRKFMNLRVLRFDKSNVEQIPNLSCVPNLEELSFAHCGNLTKVHESVGFLDKLCHLSTRGCTKLSSFPAIKLPSLKIFNLMGCSGLESFPEMLGEMKDIEKILGYDTFIKELPYFITNLVKLRHLVMVEREMPTLPSSIVTLPYLEQNLWSFEKLEFHKENKGEEQGCSMVSSNVKCSYSTYGNMSDESIKVVLTWFRNVVILDMSGNNLTFLPISIKELFSLRKLILDNCKKLEEIREMPPNIESFSASNCTSLTFFPISIKELCSLRTLILDNCEKLEEIRIPSNIKDLSAINCTSLTPSSKSMLLEQELHKGGDEKFHFPGSSIPKWFEHRSGQNSISFWFRNKLPAISLCVVVGPTVGIKYPYILPNLIINGNDDPSPSGPFYLITANQGSDHIIIMGKKWIRSAYKVDEKPSKNEWNHAMCTVMTMYKTNDTQRVPSIQKMGLHVREHKSNMDDIRFTDPLLQKDGVNKGDFPRNMQQQKNLALLEKRRKWLSLRQPPAMTLMQRSSSTSVQAKHTLTKREKAKDPIDVETDNQQDTTAPIEEYKKAKEPTKRKSKIKTKTKDSRAPPKPTKSQKTTSTTTKDSAPSTTIKASKKPRESKNLKPIASVQEGPRQVLQEKTHVVDPLPCIEDQAQDPELISIADGATTDNLVQDPIIYYPIEYKQEFVAHDSTILVQHNSPHRAPIVDSNTDEADDILAETLKELDNDHIFAELEIALIGGPTSTTSSAMTLFAKSGAHPVNIPAIKLLLECYDLLEGKDLKSVGTDKDLIRKLTDKLTKLTPLRSQLPLAFKDTTTKLERFYKDILDHFLPIGQALAQRDSLIEVRAQVLKDLTSLKERKLELAQSTAKTKTSLDEVKEKRSKLEEELKLLAKEETELNAAKEQGAVALNELKHDLTIKLAESKKISEELPQAEVVAKEAEAAQQTLSKQLEDLQQSFKIAKV